MFTGLIHHQGIVQAVLAHNGGITLSIYAPVVAAGAALGDSIACSGVCLTVVEKSETHFSVFAAPETLERSTFSDIKEGDKINIESSMQLGDKVGGHFVFGHVDAVAMVTKVVEEGDTFCITFDIDKKIARFIAEKGSVTIEGVSLTVIKVTKKTFTVMIIPHTWHNTTLQRLQKGARVNIEIDMLARYVARLLEGN